jgi:hypothetical protein
LNPKQLGNRKNLLQRVLDVYRSKFLPELNPRKNSLRMFSDNSTHPTIDTTTAKHLSAKPTIPLTAEALAAQQQQLSTAQTISTEKVIRRGSAEKNDDDESLYSGTTDSLDFHDCFSPPAEQTDSPFISSNSSGGSQKQQQVYSSPNSPDSVMLSPSASIQDLMLGVTNDDMSFGPHQTSNNTNDSCRLSISSTSSNLTSPNLKLEAIDDDDSSMFKDTITSNSMFELYADPIQLPSVGVDFEHCGFKEESVDQLNDTLINQLFHM